MSQPETFTLNWSKLYLVGVQKMDQQHQRLVQLMTQLNQSIQAGHGRQVIVPVLRELIDYTRTHFVDEEQLMLENDFPEYDAHKKDHDRFIQEVARDTREFLEGKSVPSMKLMNFLAQWLVDHIMGYDKQLGRYLKERGVA